jgi:hypothetical protein
MTKAVVEFLGGVLQAGGNVDGPAHHHHVSGCRGPADVALDGFARVMPMPMAMVWQKYS